MASDNPCLTVFITPTIGKAHQADGLSIAFTIESPPLAEGAALVEFASALKTSCIENGIEAFDDMGQIPTIIKNSSSQLGQSWAVGRATSGSIKLTYHVLPSNDTPTPRGSSFGLHSDQGGLLGSGFAIVPMLPTGGVYRNIVKWDLTNVPVETRVIWTFGEGPEPIEKIGPASVLCDSVYMVGPVQSSPPGPTPGGISDYYGYYWFGNLPANVEVIRDIHYAFFLKISEFFEDTYSSNNPYRSFVRNTGSSKSFGGTGFTRSHIFNYDDQINEVKDYDLIRRMAYEMVYNWVGPPLAENGIDSFYEGVKNCLSIYFPFRNSFRTGHYFSSTVNMLCTRYYTNPLLTLPHLEILRLLPTNAYAREMLEARAWAFIIGTDLRARRISELKRPVEDLAIKPIAKMKAKGGRQGVDEWIKLLTPLMGNEAKQRYEDFLSGSIVFFPISMFGAKSHYLKEVDQEILDFGMDRESLDEGVVKGLKTNSRAEKAGVKEGDRIVWSSYQWICVDNFETRMKVTVQRDGKEIMIEYWPRSFDKAKSWQMVEVEDEIDTPPPTKTT